MVYAIAISTLILAILVAWRWPRYRQQLLWGAVFTIPVLILDIIFAGTFTRLGFDFSDALLSVTITFIGLSASGALLATLYAVTIRRWLTPVTTTGRHHLWWLAGGVILGAGAAAWGAPLLLAVAIGLLADMLFVLFVARELFWDVFIGAIGFAVWYVLADVLFGLRASGDITGLLIGPQPLGLTLAGLPIERLLILAGIGSLCSPLFVALRGRRFPDGNTVPRPTSGKMVLGATMTVLVAALLGWFTLHYVRAPRVEALTPGVGATAIATTSALTLQFTLPVDRNTLTLDLQPAISGSWRFTQPTMFGHAFRTAVFIFDEPLPPQTTFTGRVTGIHSLWGLIGSDQTIRFSTGTDASVSAVTTPPVPTDTAPIPVPVNANLSPPSPVVTPPVSPPATVPKTLTPVVTPPPVQRKMLSIAMHYQEQPLSCEAAALKMALVGQKITVSENQIMALVGYDPTPHKGNVWGNPHQAFVGNIAGKQNTTGYGVYWEPIAKAAQHWTSARLITNGKLTDLTGAIDNGRAVVVWGTIGNAYRDDWVTKDGTAIMAWKGEHARTLIGYLGPANAPTSVILNDPVVGRVTWSTATFLANWSRFNRSGVIVG